VISTKESLLAENPAVALLRAKNVLMPPLAPNVKVAAPLAPKFAVDKIP
jgi:hypothetical protein